MHLFRYRREFGLSFVQALAEPMEAIEQAKCIWKLEAERDKLKQEQAEQQSSSQMLD